MICRYIGTECTDPYHNLALEELLLEAVEPDTYGLFLWQNDRTIVIGHNQDIYAECRVEAFTAAGGRIARRKSGGGAVYHDLGNLNFTLMARNESFDRNWHYKLIRKAMKRLGIKAEFNGRNDLTIDGRKFSGSAFYDNGIASFQHGTILVSSSVDAMDSYLTPPDSKLERNGVKSVRARVVNLLDILEGITVEDVCRELIWTARAVPLEYQADSWKLSKKTGEYAAHSWIYGRD